MMDEGYTVNPGDCLWDIARRKGTNPFLWTYIFQANDSLIVDPDRIFPNQMLRLPGPILKQPPAPAFALRPVKIPTVLLPVVVLVKDNTKQEQQEKIEEPQHGSDIEIDGLVIDETQSKLGREFYERFYAAWRAPTGAHNFTIIINERLLPSFGTQLTLKVNDTDIFQRFLQPREELIEEAVSTAVATAQDFLKNYDQMQKDVQGHDMKGNGIY